MECLTDWLRGQKAIQGDLTPTPNAKRPSWCSDHLSGQSRVVSIELQEGKAGQGGCVSRMGNDREAFPRRLGRAQRPNKAKRSPGYGYPWRGYRAAGGESSARGLGQPTIMARVLDLGSSKRNVRGNVKRSSLTAGTDKPSQGASSSDLYGGPRDPTRQSTHLVTDLLFLRMCRREKRGKGGGRRLIDSTLPTESEHRCRTPLHEHRCTGAYSQNKLVSFTLESKCWATDHAATQGTATSTTKGPHFPNAFGSILCPS